MIPLNNKAQVQMWHVREQPDRFFRYCVSQWIRTCPPRHATTRFSRVHALQEHHLRDIVMRHGSACFGGSFQLRTSHSRSVPCNFRCSLADVLVQTNICGTREFATQTEKHLQLTLSSSEPPRNLLDVRRSRAHQIPQRRDSGEVSALAPCPHFVWTRRCSAACLKSGPSNPPLFFFLHHSHPGEYQKNSSVNSSETRPRGIISSSSTSLMFTSAHYIAADALQCNASVFLCRGPTYLASPPPCHPLGASEVSTIDVPTKHERLHASEPPCNFCKVHCYVQTQCFFVSCYQMSTGHTSLCWAKPNLLQTSFVTWILLEFSCSVTSSSSRRHCTQVHASL